MTDRIIETDACVVEGMDWLAARCPKMKAAYVLTGPLPLRSKPDGFAELLSAIVGQQVSIASAAAIWGRMKEAGMTTPDACRAASED
jgi:DNA-3-methyladenine glycosylase II